MQKAFEPFTIRWYEPVFLQHVRTVDDVIKKQEKGDCHTIDTANLYGESEKILGEANAGEKFTIDTKTRGGFNPGGGTKDNIFAEAKQSKELLKTNVDIYYIHSPDASTDLEETAAAINDIYKQGFFKRFGLSNYKAEDVEKMYQVCKKNNYVLPTVYQGNYSASSNITMGSSVPSC